MDVKVLNGVVLKEYIALNQLLNLLEKQHDLLIQNDAFALEDIVQRINLCNKEIAETEIERRKLVYGKSMGDVVNEFKNDELEDNYRKIKKLLHELEIQKETNSMLIKMGLGFSNRMLNILSPDRTQQTYNSYGKIRR